MLGHPVSQHLGQRFRLAGRVRERRHRWRAECTGGPGLAACCNESFECGSPCLWVAREARVPVQLIGRKFNELAPAAAVDEAFEPVARQLWAPILVIDGGFRSHWQSWYRREPQYERGGKARCGGEK